MRVYAGIAEKIADTAAARAITQSLPQTSNGILGGSSFIEQLTTNLERYHGITQAIQATLADLGMDDSDARRIAANMVEQSGLSDSSYDRDDTMGRQDNSHWKYSTGNNDLGQNAMPANRSTDNQMGLSWGQTAFKYASVSGYNPLDDEMHFSLSEQLVWNGSLDRKIVDMLHSGADEDFIVGQISSQGLSDDTARKIVRKVRTRELKDDGGMVAAAMEVYALNDDDFGDIDRIPDSALPSLGESDPVTNYQDYNGVSDARRLSITGWQPHDISRRLEMAGATLVGEETSSRFGPTTFYELDPWWFYIDNGTITFGGIKGADQSDMMSQDYQRNLSSWRDFITTALGAHPNRLGSARSASRHNREIAMPYITKARKRKQERERHYQRTPGDNTDRVMGRWPNAGNGGIDTGGTGWDTTGPSVGGIDSMPGMQGLGITGGGPGVGY